MMLALEFGEPKSLTLKLPWRNAGRRQIEACFLKLLPCLYLPATGLLSQVAGYGMNVVKFLPPLVISDDDRRWMVAAVMDVVADAHKVPRCRLGFLVKPWQLRLCGPKQECVK